MITFIVSVYDRPEFLNACLASLAVQREAHVIVANNYGPGGAVTERIREICGRYGAGHAFTGAAYDSGNCYDAANIVVRDWETKDWLCFPSDDSLYVCQFTNIMLKTAEESRADLVYCDCLYSCGESGNPLWKPYTVLNTGARLGTIDKTSFIVRKDKFREFPGHEKGYRDGALVEQLVKDGIRHAKAPGVLVLHQ